MKQPIYLSLFFLASLLMTTGCVQDSCKQTIEFIGLEPVYMSYEEMRSSVRSESARDLVAPGKMYFRGGFIFISEINKGVHIIDNTDPKNPKNISFINVPGNHDIAVRGDILYVDSHIDLVAIDISNLNDVKEIQREENVFPYLDNNQGFIADPALGVVMEWKEVQMTEVVECGSFGRGGPFLRNDFALEANTAGGTGPVVDAANASLSGIAGSLARFALVQNVLYSVTDEQLVLFDISDPRQPSLFSRLNIGFGIETIFPYGEHLFIGSMTGMFVYDVKNPESPSYVSEFRHFRACDPVAVEHQTAYVTLSTGDGRCPGTDNQLHVIDIRDINNPVELAIHQMVEPAGVGIRDGVLFICDGDAGLKVYNAENPYSIPQNKLAHDSNIHASDVIPLENVLLLIGEDGFHQYDYSDLNNIHKISSIPVVSQ